MSSLGFLTDAETEHLWRIFGPGTAAGQQLRRLFAPTQQKAASKIKYPRLRSKVPLALAEESSSSPVKIRYPRFTGKGKRVKSEPISRGRKPFNLIQKEILDFKLDKPELDSKDLSLEKARLQESFQFSHAKVLPPAIAGSAVAEPTAEEVSEYLKVLKRTSKSHEAELVSEIAKEIVDLEKALLRNHGSRDLSRRIEEAYRDLELLSGNL